MNQLNSEEEGDGNIFQEIANFWSFQLNNEIYLRGYPEIERGSQEYFNIILTARKKYIYYFPSILSYLRNSPSKNFLEIGCGMGTDSLEFAKNGFHITGIDLAPAHLALAEKLFRHFHFTGSFIEANAEKLPFRDKSFGSIYSYGVLHHTPDTEKALKEIYRVLMAKGRAVIMLYNKWSLNNFVHWLTGRGFENVKGMNDTPITYRFSKRKVNKICSDFSICNIYTEYLFGAGWGRIYDVTPRSIYHFLSKLLGWHLIVYLQK